MISAIILTKNEEKNIKKCLDSVLFCDEIILVDDYSSDETLEIVKKYKTKVFKHELKNDFSGARNFGLSKASGDWAIFVDADEIISESLKNEILMTISKNLHDGYMISRTDVMWGKEMRYGDLKDVKLLRLAKKRKGEWKGRVHERWLIDGNIGRLKNPIYHFPHQTLTEFIQEINFYSTLRAMELKSQKKSIHFFEIALFPLGKFLNLYLIKFGFLNGLEGIIHALLMSFYSFLVRGKLYLLKNT